MTDTITLPRSVIEQAIESIQGYARETGDTQPCDAEKALRAALSQQAGQGWRPASTPPTEAQGEVLVRMQDGTCELAWASYWHGASTAFAGWTFRDLDMEDSAPTHWIPLPAAPK